MKQKDTIEIGMNMYGKVVLVVIEKEDLIRDYKYYVTIQEMKKEECLSIRGKLKLYLLDKFKGIINSEHSHLYIKY